MNNNAFTHLLIGETRLTSSTSDSELDSEKGLPGVRDAVSDITTLTQPTEEIDYQQLKKEHAELISSGADGVAIAKWAGDKFGISNWAQGNHHGEWQTLSAPLGDLTKLKKFITEGLGEEWSPNNGSSDNHPAFYLSDPSNFNTLFGADNMKKSAQRMRQLHLQWKELKTDFGGKDQILKGKVGLDIKGDWAKLTGTRGKGVFSGSSMLSAIGKFDKDEDISTLLLFRLDSDIMIDDDMYAGLCFLA